MPYAGSRFDLVAPGAGEVTRLPVVLLDDDGAPVTGETFDAAGMDVEYAKPGGTFADFPTFDTNNWHEVGRGVYEVIVRGDDATEAALLDTEGMFLLYVVTTASSANTALHAYKVSTADVVREGDEVTLAADQEVNVTKIGGDAQSVADLKDFADTGYDPATHKVAGVVLVDTTTTNTDMRGTDDALTAADVEPAPPNMSLLDITPLGEVNMGAVAGTAVTGPDDLKANVSNLDVAVSSRSSHSAADAASAVWAAGSRTLTGFGTLVADVVAGVWAAAQRTLTAFGFTAPANVTQVAGEAVNGVDDFKADVRELALEATLSLMKGATFNTSTDSLEAIRDRGDAAWITGDGAGGGDATAANQEAILAHLVAIKGPDWAGDDDTLAALAAGLAALPAEALAAIEAAHGEGPYDQAAMLAAKLVTSQFVAEGDELLFFRDTSPQAVSLVVSPPVDLSGWDLWLTIKPATPEVREEEDNASALCSVSGSGYSTGLMTFSVTAANVAGMSLDRAYDYSIEGKLGAQYRCFRRGTAKLTYNVRRNV